MSWAGSEDETLLSTHAVGAGVAALGDGQFTLAQFKTAMDASGGDPSEQDIDNLVATVTGTDGEKNRRIAGIAGAFDLAQARWPGYDTPAAVRTRLGIATPS